VLWLDLDLAADEHLHLLASVFHFHPLAIEDTRSVEGRVKLEEYPGYLFTVVRAVRFVDQTTDPYDVETFNLNCFLGPNYVVTIHGAHAPGVDTVAARLVRGPDALQRGAARLLHQILDASVDAYFPIVDQLDDFVDGLEERVFVTFDQESLRDIFAVKRLVLQLRRHLSPQREVFNILQNRPSSLITPDSQIYYRDIYDHVLRLNESLDTYRELLSSTLDAYLTQVSNRMGTVTKGLAAVATVTVPFVVVSGMWGMNFTHMPLSETSHGFWLMLGIQVAIALGLAALLRKWGYL